MRRGAASLVTTLALTLMLAQGALALSTERLSLADGSAAQGNDASFGHRSHVSADGRYVVFSSSASNLVAGDTNEMGDVFLRDRVTGATTRVSVGSGGEQASGGSGSGSASISADGRRVAFASDAANLVPGDSNNDFDVFVRDLQTGQTVRVSVSSSGQQGNGSSTAPVISADGEHVAFESSASNLTPVRGGIYVHDLAPGVTEAIDLSVNGNRTRPGTRPSISGDGRYVAFSSIAEDLIADDADGRGRDVFVRDRVTGDMEMVNVSSGGEQSNATGFSDDDNPEITPDGRYVVFSSRGSNLAPGDGNGEFDVFVRDRVAQTTELVSVEPSGVAANGRSLGQPSSSPDGRYVAFASQASNLTAGDLNGRQDVFVRDRELGCTTRVSVDDAGGEADGDPVGNFISTAIVATANGPFAVWTSEAGDLVDGDDNGAADVFGALHDCPPSAAFSTASGRAGQPVSFDGSASSDPEGNITSYGWDFGDGHDGAGSSPSHTYAAPGTYTVTLEVTDGFGQTSTTSREVVIAAARSGEFVCRATALRLPGLGEMTTANAPAAPCKPQTRSLLSLPLGNPVVTSLGANVLSASTSQQPVDAQSTVPQAGDVAAAEASVAGVTALAGTTPIIASGITARASATCNAGGETALEGSSRVATLTVGGRRIDLEPGRAIDLDLGLADVHVNSTTIAAGRVTQRAVWVETPLGDAVLGEAIAGSSGGSPCA